VTRPAARPVPFPAGARIFHRLFTRLGFHGRPPHFVAEFYPYANLTHTIRLVEDTAYVRLSDLLRAAPMPALEATAAILLSRLYRRSAPRAFVETYREFSLARATRRRLHHLRRKRGRRLAANPRGACFDLAEVFARLNRRYFHGQLHRPRLAWSPRPWRTQLGCFDPALNQIVLSSRLDCAVVPRYAVEYVLFHEMLHVKHAIRRASCGLQSHSREFRRQEKRFHLFERARRFLSTLA